MYMRNYVLNSIKNALKHKYIEFDKIEVEVPTLEKFGDYSSNVAMKLSKELKKNPTEVAEILIPELQKDENFERVEFVFPGFINFYFKKEFYQFLLNEFMKEENLTKLNIGEGKRILLEFCSANPTGPMHIGHGRGLILGDVLANLLSYVGYGVHREYYINDYGAQIEKIAHSVYLRYRELLGIEIPDPELIGYNGEYVYEIAQSVIDEFGNSKNLAFEEVKEFFSEFAINACLADARTDMSMLGIKFDSWISEKSFYTKNGLKDMIAYLDSKHLLYRKDDATWFLTTLFGDDKDRVLIKQGGIPSYYASDILYSRHKVDRNFDKIINILGADHHGYEARLRASFECFGFEKERVEVILVQMVNLFKDKKLIKMSKRSGNFVTLRELISYVGKDACKFIFITRKSDSQFDFDIDVAKSNTSENPVFYVQYAYARICSILKAEVNKERENKAIVNTKFINEPLEFKILKKLDEFKYLLLSVSQDYEASKITTYASELAFLFHSYYNTHRIYDENKMDLTNSRIYLITRIKLVLKAIFDILGVSAPESM